MANFTDDAGRLGAQAARQRRRRIEAAANIGVDIVDADGFVFDLNLMFCGIAWRELNRLKHLRSPCFENSMRVAMFAPVLFRDYSVSLTACAGGDGFSYPPQACHA